MSYKMTAVCLVILLTIACQLQDQSQESQRMPIEYRTSEITKSMGLPFSDAVRVGDLLYLSGQIGNIPGKLELVPGGIAAETRQAMQNIQKILEENSSSLDRIVKVTVMLADIKEWSEFNSVYITYFPEHLPARTGFGASGLAINARVEIECIATLNQ
jgi:reactive intermediate/imine deaminase